MSIFLTVKWQFPGMSGYNLALFPAARVKSLAYACLTWGLARVKALYGHMQSMVGDIAVPA